MQRGLTLLFLVSSLALVAFSQNAAKSAGDEQKIIALENIWNQTQINHDADAMGKMLDPEFVLTDYDGTLMSKGQFLASIRDKTNQLTVEVSEDMKLHPHGDTVVVTGATHEKGTLQGKPYAHFGRRAAWLPEDFGFIAGATVPIYDRKPPRRLEGCGHRASEAHLVGYAVESVGDE